MIRYATTWDYLYEMTDYLEPILSKPKSDLDPKPPLSKYEHWVLISTAVNDTCIYWTWSLTL